MFKTFGYQKGWSQDLHQKVLPSISPLPLNITFIFLQHQIWPIPLSTQAFWLFLVLCVFSKVGSHWIFAFLCYFFQALDTLFFCIHCLMLFWPSWCGPIWKAELAGAPWAATLVPNEIPLFLLIEIIHSCFQKFIFQLFQPLEPQDNILFECLLWKQG